MAVIYPTHTCFDDALDLVGEILKKHPDAAETNEFLLVHAIVSPEGEPFAHAWVETNYGRGVALWFGIVDGVRKMFASPVADYRAEFKVVEALSYTPREAWAENVKTGHYGPWNAKLTSLCGSERKIMGVSNVFNAVTIGEGEN